MVCWMGQRWKQIQFTKREQCPERQQPRGGALRWTWPSMSFLGKMSPKERSGPGPHPEETDGESARGENRPQGTVRHQPGGPWRSKAAGSVGTAPAEGKQRAVQGAWRGRPAGSQYKGNEALPWARAFQGMSPKCPPYVGMLSPLWKSPTEPGWRDHLQGSEEDPEEDSGHRVRAALGSAPGPSCHPPSRLGVLSPSN